jgi:mannose-6-phosphate isomerase-like protein (cupin superfamily)
MAQEPAMAAEPARQPASPMVSVEEEMTGLLEPWMPHDLAVANDTVIRLARIDGDFPWHAHDEDETFLCWDGTFRIELEGASPIEMTRGSLFVVPRGTRHRPIAEHGPAYAILIEKPETRQYGNEEAGR